MKTLKIKKENFIDWFYNTGADQEQISEALSLGRNIIERLLDGAVTITPQDILDQCEQTVIPLRIVEGYEDEDIEIGEEFDEFEIKLI